MVFIVVVIYPVVTHVESDLKKYIPDRFYKYTVAINIPKTQTSAI